MRRYPTKFFNVVLWPSAPWTLTKKMESEMREIVERAVAKKAANGLAAK